MKLLAWFVAGVAVAYVLTLTVRAARELDIDDAWEIFEGEWSNG